ncbi:MAG: hypothetical protein ACD_19C00429G0092 [uncultured bacterium]|nr:MAG: hypothetical protein ACD_19C00429G0092 [uncultured bacterium]
MYKNINLVLNKLAEWSNMTDEQKLQFFVDVNKGLVTNLINDGSKLITPETLQKLKDTPTDEVISQYLKEMSEKSEESSKIVANRTMEILEEILAPIIPSLAHEQRTEILKILESENNNSQVIE